MRYYVKDENEIGFSLSINNPRRLKKKEAKNELYKTKTNV